MQQEIDKPLFSFIIPTFNEELYIDQTIADIRSNFTSRPNGEHEIIIVDNGSSDRTVEIATHADCIVHVEPTLSISELRNHGARSSSGRIIVFVDSDVSLANGWRDAIDDLLPALLGGERKVFGSHYQPFGETPLPIRMWFIGGYENPRLSFLPGGHTILTREAFDNIGGFDAAFSTSEDIDFCHRANQLGYCISHEPKLTAVHRGDPQTIRTFLKRECWHGGSDFESVPRMFRSMTARATILFILAHICFFAAIITQSLTLAATSSAVIVGLPMFTSFYLFGRSSLKLRFFNSINAYLYYLGRSCSVRALFMNSLRS